MSSLMGTRIVTSSRWLLGSSPESQVLGSDHLSREESSQGQEEPRQQRQEENNKARDKRRRITRH